MVKVRGFAIRGLLKYVKRAGPEGGIPSLLAELPEGIAVVYEHPVEHGSWYPYPAYSELLAVVDRRLGRGGLSLMDELGRFAASHEGETPFEFMSLRRASVEHLLQGATHLWERYCDAGEFTAEILAPGVGVATLGGFRDISPHHCHFLAGWIAGMGAATGARGKVDKIRCVHRGDDVCQYRGDWTV